MRLVEAEEQKNRIRFRLIFINLRDGVEKKHYKHFQLYIISCTNAADQLHRLPFSRKKRPRGYMGSQVEREPTASCSQEEEEHRAGPQKHTATGMQHSSPGVTAGVARLLLPWSAPVRHQGQSCIPPPRACNCMG